MVTIWGLVARQAVGRGGRASVQDVCAAAVAAIQVSGAALMTVTPPGAVHVLCVTDELSERLADIELTVGEGPRADASAFGGPVLASDLTDEDIMGRWPAFAPAAHAAGAAAIFAFPLQIGAIRVGVLELYRRTPRPLATVALGDALLFADTATLLLLEGQQAAARGGGGLGLQPIALGRRRAEIDQATGMLTEQLGTGIADAFVRLRAYAYASDRQLADVAHDIVTRRLRLDDADGPDAGGPDADWPGADGLGAGRGPAGAGDRNPGQGGAR
jgi:ANTAR domain